MLHFGSDNGDLIEKINAVMKREKLFPEGTRVGIGVSGGADSVALLHILHRLEYTPFAVHLNHGIRGTDADIDEAFVKERCETLGIECISSTIDVPMLAKKKGISIEMAARQARHIFFESVLCPASSVLCLAHHADDQLETFFLRAARGTGTSGLSGMRFFQRVGKLELIRPMLEIRRSEIIRWLKSEGFSWREDVSNADLAIPRNLVRHKILPTLEKVNVRAAEHILRTMKILRDEDDFLEPTVPLNLQDLSSHPKALQRRIIQNWLIKHRVKPKFDTIEKVIEFSTETEGSKMLDLKGLRLVNEYGTLRVDQSERPEGQPYVELEKTVRMKEGIGILRGPWQASVSLAKIAGREVFVRTPKLGDHMKPYGMKGSKKVQDIFTDLKIPKARRARWPIVECGGEIIWFPGYRIANNWKLLEKSAPALHLFTS